jgi:hypothetical protein
MQSYEPVKIVIFVSVSRVGACSELRRRLKPTNKSWRVDETTRSGAGLLTTGWACSFGSPDESAIPRES